jgi:hypothetical protein
MIYRLKTLYAITHRQSALRLPTQALLFCKNIVSACSQSCMPSKLTLKLGKVARHAVLSQSAVLSCKAPGIKSISGQPFCLLHSAVMPLSLPLFTQANAHYAGTAGSLQGAAHISANAPKTTP